MGGRPLPELTGMEFSHWLVLRRIDQKGPTFWLCRCVCGTEKSVAHSNLYSGSSTNCGCVAYINRQLGRNLAPSWRDGDLPNEIWKTLELRGLATAFHPNPDNLPEVNHKDGYGVHNDEDNLEWCTHLHNMRHAWATGLCTPRPGSSNPASKLTEDQVIEIRRRYIPGVVKQIDLAEEFGVSQRAISLIVRREKWTHV